MPSAQNPSHSPDAAAAVDLGSESALLLIARLLGDGSLQVLEDHALSVRLGSAVQADGSLHAQRAERALEVLETFARRMELAGVGPARRRLVATAAARRLSDPGAFAAAIEGRAGLELEILDPEREGRLGFAGAVPPDERETSVLVDVGGGSSEVVFDGGRSVTSVPVGALVGATAFLGLDGRAAERDGGLEAWKAEVARLLEAQPGLRGCARGRTVVAVGGSASNLACLQAEAETYDPRLAEGVRVTAGQACSWADRLDRMPFEERLDLGIEPSRAELLPAGLACLGALLEHLGADSARVTGRGLRFALVEELLTEPADDPVRRG